MDNANQKFVLYSEIIPQKIEWLWYPFIPCGKISLLQGDPGVGKSMAVVELIARLTTGRPLPDGRCVEPINVIYQCSEDGLEDTIKPRLDKAGADCSRIAYIKEDICDLTLDDEIIRQTILAVNAKLLVVDPFQAYLGISDLSNASGMRRVLRKLGVWASAYNCAVMLVGHLNKKQGQNELYRGLGTVDIVALARSVIQVERSEEEPRIRYLKQVKNSLSTIGATISFVIDQAGHFVWITDSTASILADYNAMKKETDLLNGKSEAAALIMNDMLSSGPVLAVQVIESIQNRGISERTIKTAKKTLGIVSIRKEGQWYWSLPGHAGTRE